MGYYVQRICMRGSYGGIRVLGAYGGIGRRASFRYWWGNPWKFESSYAHHPSPRLRVAGHSSRNASGGKPLSLRQAKP